MVIGPHIGFVLFDGIQDVMSLPGTGGRGAAPVRTMAAVLLPTGILGAGFLQREPHRHHATDGRNGLPVDRLVGVRHFDAPQ